MHVELDGSMLHPRLGTNGVELFSYLSNAVDASLDDVMSAWGSGTEEVAISSRFALHDALDSAIELHEMPAYDNAIEADAKPLFDAMRAELLEMVARIDTLTFATVPTAD